MSGHQTATIEDTVYFWFGANDTSGSGGDGASPVFDVREAGAAAGAAPLLSGSATLLSHGDYPAGCHEIAIAATTGNGFAANDTFAVFCTLLVDSQNPTGFVGSCTLTPLAKVAALTTAQNDLDLLTGADGATLATTQSNYAPAKAGDAMALSAGAVTNASLAGNMEIVFETDFATNYNTTRNAWVNNYTDIIGAIGNSSFAAGALTSTEITSAAGCAVSSIADIDAPATWKASINTEVDNSMITYGLDHLINSALPTNWATDVAAGSVFDNIADDGTAVYDRTTDSLQAVRDHIADGTNLTEAGGDGDHLTEAGGDGDHLSAIPGSSDPWLTALPGAYGAGTAGEILGDWKDAGRLDAILDTVAADVVNVDGIVPAAAGDNMGTVSTVTGNVNGSVGSVSAGVTLAAGAVTDASLAGGLEIVFETDFATNYNTTRNAWVNNYTDIIGTMDAAAFGADFLTSAKIADGAFVADNFAASSLNGKGNWNVGKTGYALTTADWNVGKTGYSLTATTGLGAQTANITGNLSGSVGSVSGAVGSVAGAVGSVAGNVDGSVASNVELGPSEVLTQINAALDTAISELAQGAPSATPSIRNAVMLLYMALRNKLVVQTSGTDALEVYDNSGTKIAKKLITDDGEDYTEDEMTSGA